MKKIISILTILGITFSSYILGTSIKLNNGDILHGTVLNMFDDELEFSTENIGTVKIKKDLIKTLDINEEVSIEYGKEYNIATGKISPSNQDRVCVFDAS